MGGRGTGRSTGEAVGGNCTLEGKIIRRYVPMDIRRGRPSPRAGDRCGRKREGLPQVERWLIGERKEPVVIEEGRARFYVDVVSGQKTGFYLRKKWRKIRYRCPGSAGTGEGTRRHKQGKKDVLSRQSNGDQARKKWGTPRFLLLLPPNNAQGLPGHRERRCGEGTPSYPDARSITRPGARPHRLLAPTRE